MPRWPAVSVADRFWSKVDVRGPDECWEWQRFRNPLGYGVFFVVGGRRVLAHRMAWTLTYGEIPVGISVCHHCDNPPCCNWGHLFQGTAQDNMADMSAKGRAARGERNALASLTSEQVLSIRAMYSAGAKQGELAARFGVERPAISKILRGRRWAHLPSVRGRGRHGHAKLTWPDIHEIRRRYAEGESQSQLGKAFGVSGRQVGFIVSGKCWPEDSKEATRV